jgi:phospholipid/cholesterol/gamma-HCH transport system substrate-binding protein
MASARTKFSVGLFVTAGLALCVIAIIALGMTKFFDKGSTYVTFFDESVQGLNIDSPVKYRGVPIGRVAAIQVAPDDTLIQVVMAIDKGVTIKDGSQAQLNTVGITGSMFVNLDIKPSDDPNLSPKITFETEYPIIPSTPSNIAQVMSSLSVLYHRLLDIDLKGIADKIKESLDHFNTTLDKLELQKLSREARSTLTNINTLVHHPGWHEIMTSASDSSKAFQEVMARAKVSLDQANSLLQNLDNLVTTNAPTVNATLQSLHTTVMQTSDFVVQGTSMVAGSRTNLDAMQQHVLVTLQNLEQASRDLSRLLDGLQDQPSRLITGEPPQPRVITP